MKPSSVLTQDAIIVECARDAHVDLLHIEDETERVNVQVVTTCRSLAGQIGCDTLEHGMEVTAARGGNDEQHPRACVLGLDLQFGHNDACLEGLTTVDAQFQGLHLIVTGAKGLHVLQCDLVALWSLGQLQRQCVHLERLHGWQLWQEEEAKQLERSQETSAQQQSTIGN